MEAVGAVLPCICLRTFQLLRDEPIGVLEVENCIVQCIQGKTCTNSPVQERLYTRIHTLDD